MYDMAVTCSTAYFISTATATYETRVQTSLAATEKALVMGKKQVSSGTANGDNTISADTTLTSAAVSAFSTATRPIADLQFESHLPVSGTIGMTATNIGNTCASNWND